MSKRINSAFIMMGRFKGSRSDNREDYSLLYFHDFEDQEGNYRGNTEVNVNDAIGYKYNDDYMVVITEANDRTQTAKVQIKKKHPMLGMVVVQEKVIHMDKCNKLYLDGTDVVIRVGVGKFEQAMPGDNETDVLLRNIRRVENIANLKINLNPKKAKVAPEATTESPAPEATEEECKIDSKQEIDTLEDEEEPCVE